MEIIKSEFDKNDLPWSLQSIAITMIGTDLYNKASSEKWLKIFNLPDWVGGRTSITSSVGLLPLSLIDEDVDLFLNGASMMDEITRSTNINNNPSALLAIACFRKVKLSNTNSNSSQQEQRYASQVKVNA